ncbi:MAG: epimerase [Beggiatoa sp. IS2]|nr:MAG: epimerase [Beggiatoa sp. IS2]
MRKICLLGGTGFVGKHLANAIVRQGWHVKVLTRRREEHRDLLVLPTLTLVSANLYDPQQLSAQLAGYDTVINLVGILNERGHDGQGFRKAHVELSEKILAACKANGIKRLLHMSALHADAKNAPSHYLRTKGEAENLVHADSEMHVTSFRPSVIFGEDDALFNRFAQLLRLPMLFLPLACPHSRLAPVWVDDVVAAMLHTLENNPQHYGKRYHLCGPKIYTLQELVTYTASLVGVKRPIVPLNDKLSRLQAQFFERVPGKLFSLDNYLSLQVDSVCQENHLPTLGITPRSIESIVPRYFNAPTPRAVYSQFRYQARR